MFEPQRSPMSKQSLPPLQTTISPIPEHSPMENFPIPYNRTSKTTTSSLPSPVSPTRPPPPSPLFTQSLTDLHSPSPLEYFYNMPLNACTLDFATTWGFASHQLVSVAIFRLQSEGLVREGKPWKVGELCVFELLGVGEVLEARDAGKSKRTRETRETGLGITLGTKSEEDEGSQNVKTEASPTVRKEQRTKRTCNAEDATPLLVQGPDPLRSSIVPDLGAQSGMVSAAIRENQAVMKARLEKQSLNQIRKRKRKRSNILSEQGTTKAETGGMSEAQQRNDSPHESFAGWTQPQQQIYLEPIKTKANGTSIQYSISR
ncbi:hypothetical protein DM02DRAFT_660496 [Periconia macrospinosa]|uniref:Uncharacterized protein n=1 Tax=Periconia macrospinosa TaxID=97972 RepID=A0A2V1DAC0_9PLEO|nr:hypothetical protein DM02DRAFT_660496 [Periconia macrospinosa]